MRTLGITALLWTVSSLVGCQKEETSAPPLTPAPAPAMTPASRTTPAAERATEDVTRARCDRAERCGEIGLQALYASRQHCLNVLWTESVDQLLPCRNGVDQDAIQQCLAEINQHGCEDAMGGFNQFLACKVEDLCI